MTEDDFLDDRRRASEDDYFRKKDRELIEKMRAAAAADHMKTELSAKTGLSDPALLEELDALGFTPDTISVLPLVPIVEMAWAEGESRRRSARFSSSSPANAGLRKAAPPIDSSRTGWLDSRRPTSSRARRG